MQSGLAVPMWEAHCSSPIGQRPRAVAVGVAIAIAGGNSAAAAAAAAVLPFANMQGGRMKQRRGTRYHLCLISAFARRMSELAL